MVVVELAPFLIGQVVMPFVIAVVVDDADLVAAEVVAQPLGQGGLAAAGAACNADDDGFHRFQSFLFFRRLAELRP